MVVLQEGSGRLTAIDDLYLHLHLEVAVAVAVAVAELADARPPPPLQLETEARSLRGDVAGRRRSELDARIELDSCIQWTEEPYSTAGGTSNRSCDTL